MSWLLLLNAAVAAATASSAPPATPAAGVAEVRVINESARWTGLLAMNELKDDAESMFLISGEVENAGSAPVSFVKLGYELLATDGTEVRCRVIDGGVAASYCYGELAPDYHGNN